jgi:hypothetical protein
MREMHARAVINCKTEHASSAPSGMVCLISDLAGASCHNVTFTLVQFYADHTYIRPHLAVFALLHIPLPPTEPFTPAIYCNV